MGLFLAMSGVVGASEGAVVEALRSYAETREGSLEEEELTTNDDECLVLSEGVGGVTVLYPGHFFDWDSSSQHLSEQLGTPVFSFHIHDGDLWMYVLYDGSKEVDRFNPVPDYWEELDPDERSSWQGNASAVAKRVPGLNADAIAKYLVEWDDEVLESNERKKAYPADQYYYGDDWQLVDFMTKLGLDYPVDDRGGAHGATYRFHCKSDG